MALRPVTTDDARTQHAKFHISAQVISHFSFRLERFFFVGRACQTTINNDSGSRQSRYHGIQTHTRFAICKHCSELLFGIFRPSSLFSVVSCRTIHTIPMHTADEWWKRAEIVPANENIKQQGNRTTAGGAKNGKLFEGRGTKQENINSFRLLVHGRVKRIHMAKHFISFGEYFALFIFFSSRSRGTVAVLCIFCVRLDVCIERTGGTRRRLVINDIEWALFICRHSVQRRPQFLHSFYSLCTSIALLATRHAAGLVHICFCCCS